MKSPRRSSDKATYEVGDDVLITVTLKDKHQQTLAGLLTDTTVAVPNANIKPTRPKLGWWGIFKKILD